MSAIERDIFSTPAILRQTLARVAEREDLTSALLPALPTVFLGCGSSYGIALAAAAFYEAARGIPAQATIASEYLPRPGWAHLAISRTGATTELIEAMKRAHQAGGPVGLLVGEAGSLAEQQADAALALEFAPEIGVIQTRFISAALIALRAAIGDAAQRTTLARLPDLVEQGLRQFDPGPLSRFTHLVFLGRGWRYGLARLAALNLQETSLLEPAAQQTLDYRHGPIASAGPETLVWCFDPPSDPVSGAVLEEVRQTGAAVRCTDDDPQISLAQAQLLAVRQAERRHLDPDAPRHLSRAVVLPTAGG